MASGSQVLAKGNAGSLELGHGRKGERGSSGQSWAHQGVFREELGLPDTCRASFPSQAGLSLPIQGHLEFKGPDRWLSLEPVLLHPVLLFCPESFL